MRKPIVRQVFTMEPERPTTSKARGTVLDYGGVADRTLLDLVVPEDLPVLLDVIDAVLTGNAGVFEGRVRMPDGGSRWATVAVNVRSSIDSLLDPHVLLEPIRDDNGALIDFLVAEANDAACAYNGLRRDQYVGAHMLDLLPDHERSGLFAMYREVVETGVPLTLDDIAMVVDTLGGVERRFDVRTVKVGDAASCTWRDVTDRHVFEEALSDMAMHDPLTGLANRPALLGELDRSLRANDRSGRTTAVLMLDLDHFKSVNDSHGHNVGDELLSAAARRLEAAVRGGDLVARLGGDEFVVVMRDLDGPAETWQVADRIVETFRDPISVGGHELHTTASVGIAISSASSAPEDLLREADTAMYRAKEGGRDRVSLFNEDLRVRALARVELEAELRPALGRGELAVWYQPEIDLVSGDVTAVEALLRWHHPSGELYTADRFIAVAEETGVIVDSSDWVMREACLQVAALHRFRPDRPIALYFNLSKLQLADAGLLRDLDDALASSGLDPSMLCVEVAESALLNGTTTAHSNLQMIRDRGIRLAIDNFGTGYASLSYLRDHPVDVVKIDRSFVVDITSNDYVQRLVDGIIALAGRLGVEVTAEGVETVEQATVLREMGCVGAQGFLFSRAVPPEDLGGVVRRAFAMN